MATSLAYSHGSVFAVHQAWVFIVASSQSAGKFELHRLKSVFSSGKQVMIALTWWGLCEDLIEGI